MAVAVAAVQIVVHAEGRHRRCGACACPAGSRRTPPELYGFGFEGFHRRVCY